MAKEVANPYKFPYPSVEAFEIAAIDFVHSLNIGGRNALDWTERPKPSKPGDMATAVSEPLPMKPRQCSNFALYRAETGKCETCGAEMQVHPKCDACGILCGISHLEGITSPYRGRNLCGHCLINEPRKGSQRKGHKAHAKVST